MDSIDPNIVDKSMRSVFVGNVPYDVSEEKLKEIFSEIGNVVSFKLVYDRETGKPKGYGFCEYRDAQTACSAMRNLNGYEVNGRAIRVDNACTEKSRMEMQSLMQSQNFESPYGPACDPETTPEIISQMVASMSPEALFDLVKQIKRSFQNNPDETKTMLTSNPQLSYAILQALVVLKLIDVDSACAMLYKKNSMPSLLQPMDPIQQMARHIIGAPQATSLPLLQQPNTSLQQMHPLQHPNNRNQRVIDQDFRNLSGSVPVPSPVSAPTQMSVPVPVPPVLQSTMTANSIQNPSIPTTSISETKKLDPRTRPNTTSAASASSATVAAAAAAAAANMSTVTSTQPIRPVIKQEPKTSLSLSAQNDTFLKMANLQNAPSSAALGAALGMTTGSTVGSVGTSAATGAPSTDHEKATLIIFDSNEVDKNSDNDYFNESDNVDRFDDFKNSQEYSKKSANDDDFIDTDDRIKKDENEDNDDAEPPFMFLFDDSGVNKVEKKDAKPKSKFKNRKKKKLLILQSDYFV